MRKPCSLNSCLLLAMATLVVSGRAGAAEKTYQYYRFTPTKLLSDTIIQLSEFEFRDTSDAAIDVSGVTATNSTGNSDDSPGAEQPPNALDLDTGTKWLNRAAGGPTTQGIDFDFGTPTTINSYNFATANDSPGRTPVSWELYGGVDDVPVEGDGVVDSWELIDSRADQPVDQTLYTYQLGWVIPESISPVINNFSADLAIVTNGEFSIFDWDASFADTIDISPTVGSVSASGTQNVTPPNDADTTYTLTAVSTVDTATAELTVRAVTPGSATYQYIRFTPFKLRDNAAANSIQIAEFDFFANGTEIVPVGVTNPGGDNPPLGPPDPPVGGGENAEMVIDGDISTKWLDFNKGGLIFDFGTPTLVDSYSLTTANDATERDPVRWYLEGSDDELTWTLIETVTAFDFPTPTARGASVQPLAIPLPATPLPLPPAITLFIGDAPTLVAGEPLALTWDTIEATSATIDDGTGPISVAVSGSQQFMPAADTTYTLTATNAADSASAEFSTVIVNPGITSIAYADFDNAGDELGLLEVAEVVNAFATIPEPGDAKRLRLTDDVGSQSGTAWFRKRIGTAAGFDTTFGLQFVHLGAGTGADGMAFMLQNSPAGTAAVPSAENENGLTSDALNIKFDSYFGGAPEPSAAYIEVREGNTAIATVDLATFKDIRLAGADSLDLTDTLGTSVPYPVRVAYTAGAPGTLDIYFQGVQVLSGLSVDLGAIGAVDGSGAGYVGFAARTGGQTEAHDVTNWTLTEGAPSLPVLSVDIEILDSSFDFEFDEVTLTFTSRDWKTYRVAATENNLGGSFDTVLDSGLPGDLGKGRTTVTVPFTQTKSLFIRVEEE